MRYKSVLKYVMLFHLFHLLCWYARDMRVQKMKNKVNCRIASKSRHGLQLIWSPSSQGSAEDKASKKEREKMSEQQKMNSKLMTSVNSFGHIWWARALRWRVCAWIYSRLATILATATFQVQTECNESAVQFSWTGWLVCGTNCYFSEKH